MTFWTDIANSHICPGQISQWQFVGQIYLSLDKYVFKFRNNPSLALNDQAGPYTALRMPRSGEFSTVALVFERTSVLEFFYDI